MFTRNWKTRESGFLLVSTLMGSLIAGISLVTMITFLNSLRKSDRAVAATAEIYEMTSSLNQLLHDAPTCAQTHLVGTKIVDLQNPANTPISIFLPPPPSPSPSYSPAPFMSEGQSVGGLRQINFLRFSSLVNLGPVGANTLYFGTLSLRTSVSGSTSGLGADGTFRSPNFDVYVKLVIDSANVIQKCFQTTSAAVQPGQMCPGSQVMTGISGDGTILCGSDEATADFVSNWYSVPQDGTVATVNHGLGTSDYRVAAEILGGTNYAIVPMGTACPAGKISVGLYQDNANQICGISSQIIPSSSSVIYTYGAPNPAPSPSPLVQIQLSNFVWTNKSDNSIALGIVGDSYSVAGWSSYPLNPRVGIARVRLFKY